MPSIDTHSPADRLCFKFIIYTRYVYTRYTGIRLFLAIFCPYSTTVLCVALYYVRVCISYVCRAHRSNASRTPTWMSSPAMAAAAAAVGADTKGAVFCGKPSDDRTPPPAVLLLLLFLLAVIVVVVATVVLCCCCCRPLLPRQEEGTKTLSGSSAERIRRPASILACSAAAETAPATSVTTAAATTGKEAATVDGLRSVATALLDADTAAAAAVPRATAGIMHHTLLFYWCVCKKSGRLFIRVCNPDMIVRRKPLVVLGPER